MRATLLILFIPFGLSGCTGSNVSGSLHAETAIYQVSDQHTWRMAFDGPYEVLDRDGFPASLYRLAVSDETLQRSISNIYLDGQLRVVRVDFPCSVRVDNECTHASMNWGDRGALSAWGFALDRIDPQLDGIRHSTKGDKEIFDVTLDSSTTLSQGTYTFDDQTSLFPASFQISATVAPYDATRVGLERGASLVSPTLLTKLTSPTGTSAISVEPWKNDQAPVNGLAESPSRLVEILRQQQAGVEQAFAGGGCVSRIDVEAGRDLNGGLLMTSIIPLAQISVVTQSGEATRWTINRNRDIFGNDSYTTASSGPGLQAPCAELRRDAPLSIAIGAFDMAAANAPLQHGDPAVVIAVAEQRVVDDLTCPAKYRKTWQPPDTDSNTPFTPFEIAIEACYGSLVKVVAAPRDIEAFQFRIT